jgi:DNA-binding HxlR family transcriptional regulator
MATIGRLAPSVETRRPSRDDLDLITQAGYALEALHGKWKVHLLVFMARGIRRHGRLHASLPGTSKKITTETLRALERDGLVRRTVYAEVPVRVEYALTPLGWTLAEPLMALASWGGEHSGELAEARTEAA